MIPTLKETRRILEVFLLEPIEEVLANEAINAAINEIWQEAALVGITNFLGVRNVTIDSGTQGAFLVSVPNPEIAPVVTVQELAESGLPERQARFQFTWVSVFGGETEPSPEVMIDASEDSFIASVAPPIDIEIPPYAAGWNLYRDGKLATSTPADFNQIWDEGTEPIQNPRGIPMQNTTSDEIMWAEGAYVTLPNGTRTRWTNAEIGSTIWNRMEGRKANNSPYFPYVWNMASGNFVSVAPPAAAELSPDLLYVRRPPRLVNDGDMIPFPAFDAMPFIRSSALALISKTLHEWNQAAAWEAQAEKEKRLILQTQIRQNRQEFITHFNVSSYWLA